MKMVPFINNRDSAIKALALLDRATSIDTNYFLGYSNKIMFLSQLTMYNWKFRRPRSFYSDLS
jgi:hypothetical protein